MFFDNLEVIHTREPILEACPLRRKNHYYSYGLKIAAISSKAAGALQNSYLYQGDFSEFDEDAGYNEFYLRHYDAQIGRWTTTDPYEQFASPYLGMGNSPGGMVDPDGGEGTNWYQKVGTNFIQWFDGNAEIAGYKNLGESLSGWYYIGDGVVKWTNFLSDGSKMWSLDDVVVEGLRKSGSTAMVRVIGGLKAVGGTIEAGVGVAFGTATSWTGIGAVGGGLVAAHGIDVAAAGFNQLIFGNETKSFTEQGISKGLQVGGVSEGQANYWAGNADAGISVVGSGWAGGGLANGVPSVVSRSAVAGGAAKGVGSFFQGGRVAKASELVGYAEQQGWKAMQSAGGPLKYVDESGVIRMTIKQGSQRAAGSGFPHVELRNALGKRIDAFGNEVTRKGLGNHTEIIYDLK